MFSSGIGALRLYRPRSRVTHDETKRSEAKRSEEKRREAKRREEKRREETDYGFETANEGRQAGWCVQHGSRAYDGVTLMLKIPRWPK